MHSHPTLSRAILGCPRLTEQMIGMKVGTFDEDDPHDAGSILSTAPSSSSVST